MDDIRQALIKDISISVMDQCDELECEEVSIYAMGNPHTEAGDDQQVLIDIHGPEVSFAIPSVDLGKFLQMLRAKLPKTGVVKIKGLDAQGNRRCYCLRVDSALQWQLLQQIGNFLGPAVYKTAIDSIG